MAYGVGDISSRLGMTSLKDYELASDSGDEGIHASSTATTTGVSIGSLPSSTGTVPLPTQVGGHAGMLSSGDGSLVIKPSVPLEKEFYTALAVGAAVATTFADEWEGGDNLSRGAGPFSPLYPWVPKFYGVLRLEGQVVPDVTAPTKPEDVIVDVEGAGEKESLVLENLSHPFYRPNVLDIKVGTILYAPSASPAKRERMLKTARETTSLETGVRLTGFQVYNGNSGLFTVTPKSFGKSIKASELPVGIARFFPVRMKEQGEGVRAELLLRVLEGVMENLRDLVRAVERTEMRMVGGSVLIVWEGDEKVLEAALERSEADVGEEESDGSSAGGELEGVSSSSCGGPPLVVRLIDFAHTNGVPGEGPDMGVLQGLQTTIRLVQGRIEEVKQTLPSPY